MTEQLATAQLLQFLDKSLILPALPTFNRLEARPRTHDFDQALRAEVRDALWMLAKQWQVGEFFADDAENAEDMKQLTDEMSKVYHAVGLNKEQAKAVSDALCVVMEGIGAFDTRTEAEKHMQAQEFIAEQKKRLGADADHHIRGALTFIDNNPMLNADEKNLMKDLVNNRGAGFVSLVNKMKDMYGGTSSDIPIDMTAIGSLPTDAELKAEYLKPETSDVRRQEITQLRAKAGRTSRLMDAQL